jgi:L-ornithine N5-oxygenase
MESSKESAIFDLIGVGCGPSNLALAIALDTKKQNQRALNILFLEKQLNYRWHGNTITSQSDLQISFLKDLVSLRDPTSPYSFINYLHEHERLVDFINLGTFYPSRFEFNDYLCWVAKHFSHQCRYGEEVKSVEPVITQGRIKSLRVLSCDATGKENIREAKSLVISAGGTPNIPDVFRLHKDDKRIFHHANYLSAMSTLSFNTSEPLRIAVVGGGQSAAEVFIDLNNHYPSAKVDLIVRNFSLKPADSSPFVNEIFAPYATDLVFGQSQSERDQWLSEYKYTNYSAVDAPMIEQIYGILYHQKVSKIIRHKFRSSSVIKKVHASKQCVELQIEDLTNGEVNACEYDIVILATGYQRNKHRELLNPLSEYMADYQVDRNYQIQTNENFHVPIFLQGYCESSHGLSDTLLSVLAVRSDEIATSLLASLDKFRKIHELNKVAEINMADTCKA